MPISVLEAVGPWSLIGRVWVCRVRSGSVEDEALLDHQELVGEVMGGERILQDLQGQQCLWSGLDGLYRRRSTDNRLRVLMKEVIRHYVFVLCR